MTQIDAAEVFVIRGYLNGATDAIENARAALDAGDLADARVRIEQLVYDARQAQARAEQIHLLSREGGDSGTAQRQGDDITDGYP